MLLSSVVAILNIGFSVRRARVASSGTAGTNAVAELAHSNKPRRALILISVERARFRVHANHLTVGS